MDEARSIDRKIIVNPRESPQIIKVSPKFGKIICPSRMLVCGPSLSGKSTFMKYLVQYREQIFDQKFDRIIYCSPQCLTGAQDNYVDFLRKQFSDLELSSELPCVNALNITSDGTHKLILIDDFMLSFNQSQNAFKLLTIHSHHMQITAVVTSHNLFASSKFQKTLTRNYSEIVMLHARSDKLSLRTLGTQMFPDSPRILIRAMNWVEKQEGELRYLLLDISPLTHLPSNMIIRTNIFPENGILAPVYFIPSVVE